MRKAGPVAREVPTGTFFEGVDSDSGPAFAISLSDQVRGGSTSGVVDDKRCWWKDRLSCSDDEFGVGPRPEERVKTSLSALPPTTTGVETDSAAEDVDEVRSSASASALSMPAKYRIRKAPCPASSAMRRSRQHGHSPPNAIPATRIRQLSTKHRSDDSRAREAV